VYDVFATYRTPSDPAAFDSHYEQVHVPLVEKMPLLEEFAWGKVEDEGSETYLVARMTFQSAAEAEKSFGSPDGQAAADDVQNFAWSGFQLLRVPREESSRQPARQAQRSARTGAHGMCVCPAQSGASPATGAPPETLKAGQEFENH
jgi:uncharacterized protein (TIGR02118 family)